MPTRTSLLVAFTVASMAAGQVSGPPELTVQAGRLGTLPLDVTGGQFEYRILGDALDGFREYDPDPTKLRIKVIGYTPGTAWVIVASMNTGKLQPVYVCKVTVTGEVPPTPPPPGPTPPTPPPPPPEPENPWPTTGGLHVLMVYETGDLSKLQMSQVGAMSSAKVREYLNAKCAVGPDGKTRQWRLWDKDVDASGEAAVWRIGMNKVGKTLPWILISNGKKWDSRPMPTTADDLLALLKKYGD